MARIQLRAECPVLFETDLPTPIEPFNQCVLGPGCSKHVLEDHARSYRSSAMGELSWRSGRVARIASADTSVIAMNKTQARE